MKKFKITFVDEIEAESEEDAYGVLLKYLWECVEHSDVTAFDFKDIEETQKQS